MNRNKTPSTQPFEVTLDLPPIHPDEISFANSSMSRRQSNPRRSRRSDRRSSIGSLSSNSTGGGAISVESSDDVFAEEFSALAVELETDLASGAPSMNTANAGMCLDRQISSLTVDEGSTNEESTSKQLVVDKVQSRLLAKHIKSGRLSSIDLRYERSRDQLSNAAAGQRRVRTTLSFGTNISQLAFESKGTSMPRALRRNASWKLEAGDSKNHNKRAAASAGRALLGR